MGTKQNRSQAPLVDFLGQQAFGPDTILGSKLEQTSQHAKMIPFDFIRERFGEYVRRHAAGRDISQNHIFLATDFVKPTD